MHFASVSFIIYIRIGGIVCNPAGNFLLCLLGFAHYFIHLLHQFITLQTARQDGAVG